MISLFAESLLQLVPVLSGCLVIRLLGKHLDNINDGEKPSLGLLIIEAADFVFLENGGDDFHSLVSPGPEPVILGSELTHATLC